MAVRLKKRGGGSKKAQSLKPSALDHRLGLTVAFLVVVLSARLWRSVQSQDLDVRHLAYDGFDLDYSCSQRIALRFAYRVGVDTGDEKRPAQYTKDPGLEDVCQQLSTKSYRSIDAAFDRGHLVPSNQMDATSRMICQANLMTNIVPQDSRVNKGIWSQVINDTAATPLCSRPSTSVFLRRPRRSPSAIAICSPFRSMVALCSVTAWAISSC